jgi:hypothetical protein
MSKHRESKLDQYAKSLADMEAENKTLAEMLAWLKDEGVRCSASTLSRFLESQRTSRLQDRLLERIATGARHVQEVEKQFQKHPAPELDTLIKLHRDLIFHLSTHGVANPDFVKLADQLTNTVLQAISAQTKARFKEREVSLAERKELEAKKSDQEKALEWCLDEAQKFPEVQEMFKAAFAALKKARAR